MSSDNYQKMALTIISLSPDQTTTGWMVQHSIQEEENVKHLTGGEDFYLSALNNSLWKFFPAVWTSDWWQGGCVVTTAGVME